MEIAQESKQIRDLKSENLELKACLDEHQTTLELIMNKYREQMRQFMMTKKLEDNILKVLQANNVRSLGVLFLDRGDGHEGSVFCVGDLHRP